MNHDTRRPHEMGQRIWLDDFTQELVNEQAIGSGDSCDEAMP